MKPLDEALDELSAEEMEAFEETIELWVTYGGD